MQKIVPCLWFEDNVEDAAKYYTSIFPNSQIIGEPSHYEGEAMTEISGKEEGEVLTVEVSLDGQRFTLLNGGPQFKFTEAISFQIDCKDQEEVDYYWEKLTEGGGEESQCGWLKDKYGVSWQVVPEQLVECLSSPDKEKSQRAMEAMLKMKKIDIAEIQRAFEG